MRKRPAARYAVVWMVVALVAAGVWAVPGSGTAAAATSAGALSGEGGDAIGPIVQKLINADTAGLAPDTASYLNVDLDQGIADFVGTGPNTFENDFAVTERALTPAEAPTAARTRTYRSPPLRSRS
jgi:hypothetical protein